MQKPSTINKASMAIIAITAWFAVILQLYLVIADGKATGQTLTHQLVFFFSFFTILTNIMVAVAFTARLVKPASYFYSFPVMSAITLYIVVVGVTYNTVLRNLLTYEGASLLANELLHVVVPVLVLLYWVFLLPKQKLQAKHPFIWLWYPAAYMVWVLLRGAVTNEYPYPFVNVAKIGYPQTAINSGYMLLLFLGMGFLFVGVSRLFKPWA